MSVDVLMPVVTTAGEEAVVTAWFVEEGQACHKGQLIAETQAEKTAIDIEAPADGFVVDLVAIGDPVPQGDPICRVVETAETAEEVEAQEVATVSSSPTPAPLRASPAAKRVARELGVELAGVAGSGPEGRITEADVRAKITPTAPSGSTMSRLRAVIARNMRRSHLETAPVTLFSTVDMGEQSPRQITATIMKALATTLPDHPHLNGRRAGDSFTPSDHIDLSVAIQTDAGLVAPVVHDVGSMTVDEVSSAVRLLADKARAGSLTVTDYEGGSFTITNLGSYGVDGFTPIINFPQMAILGVGAVRQVPRVTTDGGIGISHQLVLSLTFDHAFVDGAPAAAFLKQLSEVLVA